MYFSFSKYRSPKKKKKGLRFFLWRENVFWIHRSNLILFTRRPEILGTSVFGCGSFRHTPLYDLSHQQKIFWIFLTGLQNQVKINLKICRKTAKMIDSRVSKIPHFITKYIHQILFSRIIVIWLELEWTKVIFSLFVIVFIWKYFSPQRRSVESFA